MLVMTEQMEKAAINQGVVVTSNSSNVTRIEAAESHAVYMASEPSEAMGGQGGEVEKRMKEQKIV